MRFITTRLLIALLLLSLGTQVYGQTQSSAQAQKPVFGVKTNLLYWATTSPNIGVEFRVAPRWTIQPELGWNTWDYPNNSSIRHWIFIPEGRYWFCQAFEGHFLGLHLLYGQFDAGNWNWDRDFNPFFHKEIYDHIYNGWGAGAGLAYGYHFPLGKRWGLELTLGAGYVYFSYDKYKCENCRELIGNYHRNYFGPTKSGVNLIYLIH